jgi:hypothetical protein
MRTVETEAPGERVLAQPRPGGHNEADTNDLRAEQTIDHDVRHPSHVLLPIMPEEVLTP